MIKLSLVVLLAALPAGASLITTDGLLSFETDVRPVFKQRCAKCHSGNNALPNVLEYDVAYGLRGEILERVVRNRTMPMYSDIQESERSLIGSWVRSGAGR